MFNCLPVSQIVAPQNAAASAPTSGAAGAEGDSAFREMFGGMLGMSAPASTSSDTQMPSGLGSAVAGSLLAVPVDPVTGSAVLVQADGAQAAQTVAAVVQQLTDSGMQKLTVAIDPASLSSDQLSVLQAAGVSLDAGRTSVTFLVAPEDLQLLTSMLNGQSAPSAVPVVLVGGQDGQVKTTQALLMPAPLAQGAPSADSSAPAASSDLVLQFNSGLLAEVPVEQTGQAAATGGATDESDQDTELPDPADLIEELYSILLAALSLSLQDSSGKTEGTGYQELLQRLRNLVSEAAKLVGADAEVDATELQKNPLTGFGKLLEALEAKLTHKDEENVDKTKPAEDENNEAGKKDEDLHEVLASLVVLCHMLAQFLAGQPDIQSALNGSGEGLDVQSLARSLGALDNLSDQERQAALDSLLTGMTPGQPADKDTKDGSLQTANGLTALLELLRELAGNKSVATQDGAVSGADSGEGDTQSTAAPAAPAAPAAQAETSSAPAAASTDKQRGSLVQTLQELIAVLEKYPPSVEPQAEEKDESKAKPAGQEDKAGTGTENRPFLAAAHAMLDLLVADQPQQAQAAESQDTATQPQLAAPSAEQAAPVLVDLPVADSSGDTPAAPAEASPDAVVKTPAPGLTSQPSTVPSVPDAAAAQQPVEAAQTKAPAVLAAPETAAADPQTAAVPAGKAGAAQPEAVTPGRETPKQAQSTPVAVQTAPEAHKADTPNTTQEKISIPVQLVDSSATTAVKAQASAPHQQAIQAYAGRNAAQSHTAHNQDSRSLAAGQVAANAQALGATVESISSGGQGKRDSESGEGKPGLVKLAATGVQTADSAPEAFRSELSTARPAEAVKEAPSTPAARALNLVNQAEVLEKLSSAARLTTVGGTSEIRIKLEPDSLGSMRVHLSVDDNHGVTARIQVESHEARSIIENSLQRLKDSLAEQGLRVEKFNVDVRQDQGQQQTAGGRDGSWRGQHGSALWNQNGEADSLAPDATEPEDIQSPKNLGYNTVEWVA
ncbi:flagellar hook-length control protein FliK [bacterium]|nr:flagellar hook-length control protein FliK [bacterium]